MSDIKFILLGCSLATLSLVFGMVIVPGNRGLHPLSFQCWPPDASLWQEKVSMLALTESLTFAKPSLIPN